MNSGLTWACQTDYRSSLRWLGVLEEGVDSLEWIVVLSDAQQLNVVVRLKDERSSLRRMDALTGP